MIIFDRWNRYVLFTIVILVLLGRHEVTISQTFTKITTGSPVSELGAWRSVNWVDYDRDGDLDLFVTRGKAGGQDNVLFRNEGSPGYLFTRMSSLSISQDHDPSDGSSWGDYDNDGYLDCFAVNWYNRNNLLYQNNSGTSFTKILTGQEVTNGGYSETGSWGDYNNDGLVDLYVGNSSGNLLNFLYKNTGSGQFTRITSGPPVEDAQPSRGVNWVDYDNDGDLDLFVANESNTNNALYKNMFKETGVDTFARVTGDPLVTESSSSWSGSWADYDDDGDPDVFITNWGNETNSLFNNNGDGTFTKVTTGSIVSDAGWWATAAWADYDNDGDLDLTVTSAYRGTATTNALYKNLLRETGTATFQRILTGPIVTDQGYMYGLSWGDFDNDGDLDLFVARTFGENQTNAFYMNDGNANHWLNMDCRGTQSNAAAIGTKVRAKAVINGQPVWQLQVIEGQSGYCGQNLQLHFGLGNASVIDSLQIDWPSGNREVWTNISVDRHLLVVENDSTPLQQVLPAEGFINTSSTLSLQWKRGLYFSPYRLQVSTDSAFTGGMVADTIITPDTLAQIRVQHNLIKYYWRVKSARSVHSAIWSTVRSFENNVTLPAQPLRLAPLDYAVNVARNIQLRWTNSSGATSYHVRAATDSLFTTAIVDTELVDTVYTFNAPNYLTRYFWIVRGKNVAGESPASPPWRFTTIIESPEIPVLTSPPDVSVDEPPALSLSWFPANRATSYLVQLSAESTFVQFLINDSSLTMPTRSIQGLGSRTTYFWRVRAKNIGGTSLFSAVWRFTTILESPNLLLPADSSHLGTTITFTWGSSASAAGYRLQITRDLSFATVDVDDSTLTDTVSFQTNLQPDQLYYWRVRAYHPLSISAWTPVRRFETTLRAYHYQAERSWNLLSVPARVADLRSAILFTSALSPAYAYTGGSYIVAETLKPGQGYWIRFTPFQEVTILGTQLDNDTIDVQQGWNLIGSISTPLPASSIISIPGGIVTSGFFRYAGYYQASDTIHPGHGYWMKSDQAGKLVLNAATAASAVTANRIRIIPDVESPPSSPDEKTTPVMTDIPSEFALHQSYPNPFNPTTVIKYQLSEISHVTLKIYNTFGQEVATLVNEMQDAGFKSAEWNAASIASGVYVYRIVISGQSSGISFSDVRKMMLLK